MTKKASRAPASVAQNVEKVIQVENETLRPRSRSEAVTDTIGGFVGTISFVIVQLAAFAVWIIVNAGTVTQLAPFHPLPSVVSVFRNSRKSGGWSYGGELMVARRHRSPTVSARLFRRST